jgi:ABC-type oligopeptide transport system substrate-binding subunit
MNIKIIFIFGLVFIFTLFNSSCNHDLEIPSDVPEVSFSKEVLPIFQTGCAISGCHDENTAKDDEIYTNYQNIISSIDPGNPENSKSYKAMTNYFETMPPEKPLSSEDRTKIRVWILQGAKNN